MIGSLLRLFHKLHRDDNRHMGSLLRIYHPFGEAIDEAPCRRPCVLSLGIRCWGHSPHLILGFSRRYCRRGEFVLQFALIVSARFFTGPYDFRCRHHTDFISVGLVFNSFILNPCSSANHLLWQYINGFGYVLNTYIAYFVIVGRKRHQHQKYWDDQYKLVE